MGRRRPSNSTRITTSELNSVVSLLCSRRFLSGQCQLLYKTCSWTPTLGSLPLLAPWPLLHACLTLGLLSLPGIQRASFKAYASAGMPARQSTTMKPAAPARSRLRDLFFLGFCSHLFCAATVLCTLPSNIPSLISLALVSCVSNTDYIPIISFSTA
jgi:hypothetical protein